MKLKFINTAVVGILFLVTRLLNVDNAGLIFNGTYTYYQDDNGLDWVYASPCAGVGGCGNDVTLIDGFGFADSAAWNASFADLNALISAFDLNNYNASVCAASFFGSGYSHCDAGDVLLGYVWGAPVGIAASVNHAQNGSAETFLVRGQREVRDIPEPTSLAIFALALLGVVSRRVKK